MSAPRRGASDQAKQQLEDILAIPGDSAILASAKEGIGTDAILEAHALTPLFDRVVSGDTFPARKPDPAGVHACMEAFGVTAARTLFVGDSAIDVATARNAGVAVWALPYGYNMGEPVESCRPDRVITGLTALLEPGLTRPAESASA